MTTQHTPGPWTIRVELDEVDQIERKVIAVPGPATRADKYVAAICTWGGSPDPEADANARLIAAAPRMKELLVRYIDNGAFADWSLKEPQFIRDVRALLKEIDG